MLGQCLQAPTQIPFVLAHHDAEGIVFLGNSQQLDHLDLFQTKADFSAQVGDAPATGRATQTGAGRPGRGEAHPLLALASNGLHQLRLLLVCVSVVLVNLHSLHCHLAQTSTACQGVPIAFIAAHFRFRAVTLCQQTRVHDTECSTPKDAAVVDGE